MRTRLRVLGSALLALALGCASAPPPPVETGQLFLWEVDRSDGGGGVAHVLGSVHMGQESFSFDPAVERALGDSDTLVLEVDPSELQPEEMVRLSMEKGQFQDGRTLDQVLSPDTWAALTRYLDERKLPVAMFRPMEPWFALQMLQVMALEKQGFEPDRGVEMSLAQEAQEESKPTRGLESAAEQLDIFDSLPMALQERMLREFLTQAESGDGEDAGDTVGVLIDAWRKGDAARIESEVFGELAHDPSLAPYFERMYFQRNRTMAHDIAGLVDGGGRWFVAVGAAHVVGARGIPSLLAAQGYRVRRVPKTVP